MINEPGLATHAVRAAVRPFDFEMEGADTKGATHLCHET